MSRAKSFWAWGFEDRFMSEEARDKLCTRVSGVLGAKIEKKPLPVFDPKSVGAPRRDAPKELAAFSVQDARIRAGHTYGKGYADLVRAFRGEFADKTRPPPDFVLFPESEEHVVVALEVCSREKIALIPFGGGTSVVGGVEGDVGDPSRFTGTCSLDMSKMNRVLEVDQLSRAARIQGGAFGPEIESQLAEKNVTLRHFPQSFEFSTLGGWIATRSGGHYATGPTRIDDFVESVRMVTPKGILDTRRLPSSGAGPAPSLLALGSEGAFGVITEAWLRVQAKPRWRAAVSVHFTRFEDGVVASRKIAQSGLFPSNCRLLDAKEALMHEVADDGSCVLILGFESSDHPVEPWMERALSIATDTGGDCPDEPTYVTSGEKVGEEADAVLWKRAFLEAPYLQSALVSLGVVADTFETACTWDKFDAFYTHVSSRTEAALKVACGGGIVTSRFSHVYPDGPAPYFTFVGNPPPGKELEAWAAVKNAASKAIVEAGGTITHHHAVGRLHRPYYEEERSPVFGSALVAVKHELDPAGILNPGALLPAK